MNADEYARVKQIFRRAIQLPPDQRDEFVTGECGGDSQLASEVTSLLAHHSSQTLLPDHPSGIQAADAGQLDSSTVRRRTSLPLCQRPTLWQSLLAATVVSLVLALAVAEWQHRIRRDEVLRREVAFLEARCQALATAIARQLDDDRAAVEAWSENAALAKSIERVSRLAQGTLPDRTQLRETPYASVVREIVEAKFGSDARYAVWDQQKVRLFASAGATVGSAVAPHVSETISRVLTVGDALWLTRAVDEEDSVADRTPPMLGIVVPVRAEGTPGIVGAIYLENIGTQTRIADLLSSSVVGATGRASLFSRAGQLLDLGQTVDAPVSEAPTAGGLLSSITPRLLQCAVSGLPANNVWEVRGAVDGKFVGAWRWLDNVDLGVVLGGDAVGVLNGIRRAERGLFVMRFLVGSVLAGVAGTLAWARFAPLPKGALPRVGGYTLTRLLGTGGMGVVYEARHEALHRPVAIKLLKPEMATESLVRRFAREVQCASRLAHPNTVSVYDYGQAADGRFFYVMEYLVGIHLDELVRRFGAVPVARAAYLLRQIAGSLREAHRLGLVHRDIKPQNIMICACGGEADVVKVLDFGLVKEIDAEPQDGDTSVREWAGTPRYMSPERLLQPSIADPRSDIYSFGAVAYWLVAGRDVFESATDDAVLNDIVLRHPSLPELSKLPTGWKELIESCLAKPPSERPQSMGEVLQAIDDLSIGTPWKPTDSAAWWEQNLPELWQQSVAGTPTESQPSEPTLSHVA